MSSLLNDTLSALDTSQSAVLGNLLEASNASELSESIMNAMTQTNATKIAEQVQNTFQNMLGNNTALLNATSAVTFSAIDAIKGVVDNLVDNNTA